MSDHAWVQEHIAAYLARGLDAAETERVEAHARDCAECDTALTDARRFDTGLRSLFAEAHPDTNLEDRAVTRLRDVRAARRLVLDRRAKWAGAIAAVIILGVIGAVTSNVNQYPPPEALIEAANSNIRAKQEALAAPGVDGVRPEVAYEYPGRFSSEPRGDTHKPDGRVPNGSYAGTAPSPIPGAGRRARPPRSRSRSPTCPARTRHFATPLPRRPVASASHN